MLTISIRTVFVYILVILAVRLMGKRQLGELQPNELVTTILISNLASLPIEETDLPILAALAPIFIIVCLEIIFSVVELKSPLFSKIMSGSTKTVIKDGVIDQTVMRSLRYSVEDLLEALRNKDVYDIQEIEYAIIETNGQLNIYKKHAKQNPVNEDLDIQPSGPARPPVAVVIDGKKQEDALAFCNRDDAWLDQKLAEMQLDLKDVLLLQCDVSGACHAVERTF